MTHLNNIDLSEEIISPDDPEFQLGRDLYDAQVLFSNLDNINVLEVKEVKAIIRKYCRLINAVGLLRAECIRRENLPRHASPKR